MSSSTEKWWPRRACADMDTNIFFPHDGEGVGEAGKICARCEVQIECLEYAILNRIEHGVWGGASERERKRIIRRRRDQARLAS